MGLHLGSSEKLKISFLNDICNLDIYSISPPILNGTMVLASDNAILTDKNGVYLTLKKGE